jgi:phosphoribosylformylglycinamidine (FGAM) synthase PurS component
MIPVEVLVRLKAEDPWSFTALETLNRKMGMPEVAALERARSWTLVFEDDDRKEARRAVDSILRETALLANPNRDVWTVREAGDRVDPGFWKQADAGSRSFVVRVAGREDLAGSSTLSIIRRRLEMTTVREVAFRTIWLLEISPGDRDPAELAQDIALARTWKRGLLANPHSQEAEIFPLRDYSENGDFKE